MTGLLTGQDILQALQEKDLGDGILLPSLMLKHGEACFLDDMTVQQLAAQLKVPIIQISSGAENLIEVCTCPVTQN